MNEGETTAPLYYTNTSTAFFVKKLNPLVDIFFFSSR